MVTSRYVYAVMRPEVAEAVRVPEGGVDGAPVSAVTSGEVGALVSPFSAERARSSRANLTAHQRVVEDAFAAGTVLPMRFGTVMPDDRTVEQDLLKANSWQLTLLLAEMSGKAEFRVKARYLPDVPLREALEASPALRRARSRLGSGSYGQRIQLGEMAVAAVEDIRAGDSAAIVARLERHAVTCRVSSPAPELALSAAFLLDEPRRATFESEVDRVAAEQRERLRFEVLGPLAPWDFVDLDGEVRGVTAGSESGRRRRWGS